MGTAGCNGCVVAENGAGSVWCSTNVVLGDLRCARVSWNFVSY